MVVDVLAFLLIGKVIRDGQFGNGAGLVLLGVVVTVEQVEEYPLGPAIVFGVGSVKFAVPVVAEAEAFYLAADVVDVVFGGDAGVGAGLDGVLFGG